jgi:hypothetical protein
MKGLELNGPLGLFHRVAQLNRSLEERMIRELLKRLHLIVKNEPFITMIRVAQEDPEIKAWLMGILSLDNFNRKSAVNTLLEQLILEKAPSEFISAIESLRDDQVAHRALEILTKGKSAPG